MKPEPCRCGYVEGTGPHPCHYNGYTCRKPATFRLYGLYLPCLAGVQMKLGASGTWACAEHWSSFTAQPGVGSSNG